MENPRAWEQEMLRDGELQRAVDKAVQAADHIILEASDGSVEETNLLTAMVAEKFNNKVIIPLYSNLYKKRLFAREAKK